MLFLSSLKFCLPTAFNHEDADYLPKLGGYINNPSPTLINYTINRIGDDKIFSTYASAVEAMTNQFQPSGTDYIIHVLGDKQRELYLQSFEESNFKYATTINPYYIPDWGNWIIQANWFFHRILYENYKPVFTNGYQIYWETSSEVNKLSLQNVGCEIVKVSESQTKIVVTTDKASLSGTADVKILYSLNFKEFFRNMDVIKSVTLTDVLNKEKPSGLKSSSNIVTDYVPITIVNGYGEVIIDSAPVNNVKLEVWQVDVENIFLSPFNYAYASNINDVNWENGISRFSNDRFIIDSAYTFDIALDKASKLKINSKTFNIIDKLFDGKYHTITLDGDASDFAFPNIFEIIH